MKILKISLYTIFILTFSCSGTKSYKKGFSEADFKNDTCPDFKIEAYKSGSTTQSIINTIDVLPIFFDVSLKDEINNQNIEAKEVLRKRLESIVLSNLKNQNIKFNYFTLNDFSPVGLDNYKHSVRSSSFAFAHGHYVPKSYYTKSINQIGTEKYKLSFFFQIFPNNKLDYERIYIHVLLYDTEKEKNVYYEYFIYEHCSIRHLENFSNIINTLIGNFKERNIVKSSE